MTQYAGSPVWHDDVTLADDSAAPTASAFNVSLEGEADREAWLKKWAGDPLVALANIAALKAVTTPFNNMVRLVKHFGIYVFESASAATVGSPYVLAADDATPGRWIRAGNSLRTKGQIMLPAAGYLSTIDPSGVSDVGGSGTDLPYVTRSKSASFAPSSTYWNHTAAALHSASKIVDGALVFFEKPGLTTTLGLQFCIDKYLTHGATLSSVTAGVQPAAGRVSMPLTQMSLGIFKSSGSGLLSLRSSGDFTADAQVDLAHYEVAHIFDVACDQNNVIDLENASYFIQFWNEYGEGGTTGTLAGNKLRHFFLNQLNVADAVFT